jgi:hypothetical protein
MKLELGNLKCANILMYHGWFVGYLTGARRSRDLEVSVLNNDTFPCTRS